MSLKVDFVKHGVGGHSIRAAFEMNLAQPGITVLLGPSGAGKTALLRVLAGLDRAEKGLIQADGRIWFHGDGRGSVETPDRPVGYYFRELGLTPHVTVASNISIGLRKWPTRARGQRVTELLGRLGMPEAPRRRPSDLSEFQKRLVLLARAVAPRPRLLLLDDPCQGLERKEAALLIEALEALLKAENLVAILVTPDQQMAEMVGTRMLRMEAGRIVQDGRPGEALNTLSPAVPKDSGPDCVIRGRVAGRFDGQIRIELAGAPGRTLFVADPGGAFEQVQVCIGSEGIAIERPGPGLGAGRNRLSARVREMVPEGSMMRVRLDCGFALAALIPTWACHDLRLRVGDPVFALVKSSAIRVIPSEAVPVLPPHRATPLQIAI